MKTITINTGFLEEEYLLRTLIEDKIKFLEQRLSDSEYELKFGMRDFSSILDENDLKNYKSLLNKINNAKLEK